MNEFDILKMKQLDLDKQFQLQLENQKELEEDREFKERHNNPYGVYNKNQVRRKSERLYI